MRAMPNNVADLSHVIQLAVAPVFLLTAIATMINAMNVRLSRIIDRRRVVLERLKACQGAEQETELKTEQQLLWVRSGMIYKAIFFAVLAALLVCMVVAGAFVGAIVAEDISRAVAVLFVLAMLALIAGLGLFLREIFVAVRMQQVLESARWTSPGAPR
jgi:hypothetical protein